MTTARRPRRRPDQDAPRTPDDAPADAGAGRGPRGERPFWQAGLDAFQRMGGESLSLPSAEAVTESLQGGFRRLEEVFDERVAAALARLGMPTARDLDKLARNVEALAAEVRVLQRRLDAPARRAPAARTGAGKTTKKRR